MQDLARSALPIPLSFYVRQACFRLHFNAPLVMPLAFASWLSMPALHMLPVVSPPLTMVLALVLTFPQARGNVYLMSMSPGGIIANVYGEPAFHCAVPCICADHLGSSVLGHKGNRASLGLPPALGPMLSMRQVTL